MIKFIDILNEIGEGNANSYPYTSLYFDASGIFKFITDSNLKYKLTLSIKINALEIEFGIDTGNLNDHSETNRGELFKVMATIFKIVFNYVKDHSEIKYIRWNPKQKENRLDNIKPNQRDELYKKYILKYIPNAKIFTSGGTTFAQIKDND